MQQENLNSRLRREEIYSSQICDLGLRCVVSCRVRKLRVQRARGGGIIYRETGLKVSIVITIGETFNWVWFNLNEERRKSLRD